MPAVLQACDGFGGRWLDAVRDGDGGAHLLLSPANQITVCACFLPALLLSRYMRVDGDAVLFHQAAAADVPGGAVDGGFDAFAGEVFEVR